MILHIPHSSIHFPTGACQAVPASEIDLMTDWYTDELFRHADAYRLVFEWSRYYCDVERLMDDPMEQIGQGIVYSKLRNGTTFRSPSEQERAEIMSLYRKWHTDLVNLVRGQLVTLPRVVVVDCHSFCADQVSLNNSELPDICIGMNEPSSDALNGLVAHVVHEFETRGLSTALNRPYGGAIAPVEDERAFSLMIEVNKRVYLASDHQHSSMFASTLTAIDAALCRIRAFEQRSKLSAV